MNATLESLARHLHKWDDRFLSAAWPITINQVVWLPVNSRVFNCSEIKYYTKMEWHLARLALGLINPFTSPEEDEAWADAERRMDTIGQNGNTAEHYDAPPLKLHSEEERMQKIISDLKVAEHYKEPPVSEKYAAYQKDVRKLDSIDVYETHRLFAIDDPSGCLQHASKKLLLSGVRTGGKTKLQDIEEARDTLNRWLEMERRT
jgi:hypothetical protein